MSRWLDLATQSDVSRNSFPDALQEPAKRGAPAGVEDFLQVSAGCREEKSESGGRLAEGATSNVISLEKWLSKLARRKEGALCSDRG